MMDPLEQRIAELERELRDVRKQIGRIPARFAIGNGGGGGAASDGVKIYYAPTYNDLILIFPSEQFAFGFTTTELQLWGWENDPQTWYCLSHIKGLG